LSFNSRRRQKNHCTRRSLATFIFVERVSQVSRLAQVGEKRRRRQLTCDAPRRLDSRRSPATTTRTPYKKQPFWTENPEKKREQKKHQPGHCSLLLSNLKCSGGSQSAARVCVTSLSARTGESHAALAALASPLTGPPPVSSRARLVVGAGCFAAASAGPNTAHDR
jgi:hypothetical protein